MTFSNTHLKAIEIETERRLSAKTRFDPYAKSLWDNALNSAYLDDNCSKWNNVIPSLLLHLRESRLLFV